MTEPQWIGIATHRPRAGAGWLYYRLTPREAGAGELEDDGPREPDRRPRQTLEEPEGAKRCAIAAALTRARSILEVAETLLRAPRATRARTSRRSPEQVGVQKTALYYYFPSKAALYVAVLDPTCSTAFDVTLVAAAVERDLPHRRRAASSGFIDDAQRRARREGRNYSQPPDPDLRRPGGSRPRRSCDPRGPPRSSGKLAARSTQEGSGERRLREDRSSRHLCPERARGRWSSTTRPRDFSARAARRR